MRSRQTAISAAHDIYIAIYAITFFSLVAVLIIWRISLLLGKEIQQRLISCWKNHIVYRPVGRRLRGSTTFTVFTALCVVCHAAASLVVLVFGDSDVAPVSRRAALLFIINCVPLYAGGRASRLIDKILQFPLSSRTTFHRWLGRLCVVLATIHVVLAVKDLNAIPRTSLALCICLSGLALLSILPIRRAYYELFLFSHTSLAIALAVLLWLHIDVNQSLSTICLGGASGIWVLDVILRILNMLYQNMGFGSSNRTRIKEDNATKTLELEVELNRPWRIQAGQYVYVTVPSASHLSIFQAHPYFVAWVYSNDDERYNVEDYDRKGFQARRIILFAQIHRGFSSNLSQCLTLRDDSGVPTGSGVHRAILDGPYGSLLGIYDFDTLIFIAQGIGVMAYLFALRQLVQAHNKKRAQARRLTLLWQLEHRDQEQWANEKLLRMLDREYDKRRVLNVIVYENDKEVKEKDKKAEIVRDGYHRTNYFLKGKSITEEITAEAGSVGISVCTGSNLDHQVRKIVRTHGHPVTFVHPPWQPDIA